MLFAQNSGAISLNSFTASLLGTKPSPTPQTSRPKRNTKTQERPVNQNGNAARGSEAYNSNEFNLAQILASADFNLIGLVGTVNPANQTVPKNTPTSVLTSIQVPEGADPTGIISQLNANYRIRGELTGPSLTSPRIVQAPIGQPLPIPPLPNIGDHVLQNLRIVNALDTTGATIAPVMPDSVGINVIDNILVTQVQVNEMTYEQIIQSGINLNSSNYNYYNFVLGLATTSGTVPIQIPVALPTTGGQPPVVGNPTGGVGVGGVSIPDIVPVMLEGVNEEGEVTPIPLPGGGGGGTMQIPGVVVFPGRIGLLHQFFEAIVIVANGAPNGTPLVITNLRAKAKLPDAGTPNSPADDPLRIAETQQGGVQTELDIHGLGADGRYGTSDDTTSFNPGQSGQATFLVEGLKEGLHTVNFDILGTLQGLPGGNITIRGSVPGAVLVRDAEFGVTFTHPAVVRAGQEYDLGLTVFNSGNRNLNGVVMKLRGNGVSGAELIDDEEKMLQQTIPPGGSGTVKWRLRSNTTGQVTASYVKVGENINAGLNLVTGVGDRNVPLSPDSLILPNPVENLPPDVVEAARQMLGQAWSVASAPPGSLPSGVLSIDKQTVIGKAVELGWAGLRVEFHEDKDTTLRTLLRDWLGENQSNSSSGFADALRNTTAGYYFYDVVGTEFYKSLAIAPSVEFHKKLVDAEASRSAFISALITQPSGQSVLSAKIISPGNQSVGFGGSGERFGDLRTGASLNLLQNDPHNATNDTRGNLLLVSKPATTGNWSLELFGRADGNADVSILTPTTGKNYRQLVFSNVAVTAGKRYRISFKASGTSAPVIEEFINGAYSPVNLTFTSTDVADPIPVITGVVQVTEDVIEGGDKYGRLVGVLFSKPMVKTSVESINRYQIGGGELVSDPARIVGRLIKPTGAYQNFGERFSILALDSPVGPYINRNLTANGIIDKSGKTVANSTRDIEMRVSPQGNPPGGYMTGRVMQADGTAVPNAGIFYRRMKSIDPDSPCGLFADWETISYQKADANGEFTIDYVREGDCHPVTVLFQHTATNSEKTLISNVAYNGQHFIFNAVFLARGNVQGTVTSGGVPLANANVSILSELDPLNNKLVRTDAQGFYSASGVPVGGITVKAVGTGAYSLSSGIAAGNLSEAGGTATINVTTQNVSGIIRGKVLDSGSAAQSPVPNSLVIARANIPGFPSLNGPIPVGFSFTKEDGTFSIEKLPVGTVYLEAIDPQRGVSSTTTIQLTAQNTRVENVIMFVSNGFGRVLGKVVNELGQPIPDAIVQDGSQAVRADTSGNYILPRTREGNATITATDPTTRQTGSTIISVTRNEDTNGANIVIRRPAHLNGQVFITQNGTTTPLAQAYVTADGLKIVRTDAQGRYTLNDVESGKTLTLRFVHPQGRLFVNTDVFLNPGETLSRNATFKPGRIHGKITQPDEVTPVVTGVYLKTVKPHFNQDAFFGLPEEVDLAYQTTTDGLYAFESLNPVNYRVSASNVFFPVPISQSGIMPPNGNLEINLSLVDTLAGKIHGHIYQPDGITPVGKGVKVSLGGGSLADVTVRTDENGYYEFAEVFSEGGYTLTALDPQTNRTNRTGVSIRKNEDIEVNLRLLGRGRLKVKALDGGGVPLQTGSIRIEGSTYPNDQRYIELTPRNNGEFEFAELTEGTYAVSALYLGLGGRVSATVTRDALTEVTVQVQAVGTVTGRVFMPDGTTPVGLADVNLVQNGRIIGLITTQDSEEERGKFSFDYVPTGNFTIEVFDNRSGRRGRSAGTITQQGQNADVTVNLLALGTVVGQVASNGIPVDHVLINLSADGSGISGTSRVATTDDQGRFRFPGIPVGRVSISVSGGPGGLSGYSQGIISGTTEPLPDTVIDVALTPSASVTGTVYKFGGNEVYSGALVRVASGYFSSNTTTDMNGKYRVDYVPLGIVNVRVESPFGYDRGKSEPVVSDQPAATVTADVTMAGVGAINGIARGSNGNPLSFGKVTFTNNAWNENITVLTPVQPDGSYSLTGLPAGDFNLTLTIPEIIGVGAAADNLSGGQTLTKNLQLESAGKVFGIVRAADGTSPAVGADVVLSLNKQGGDNYTFITHTDSNGNWEIANLPLGTISIRITDANAEGEVRLSGLNLNANGQEINTGTIVLDNSPVTVESVTPVNNSVNVARNTTVQILFSEAVDPSTIGSNSIRLKNGTAQVGVSRAISNEGKTVTLTPNPILADATIYTLEITTGVKDVNGNALNEPLTSIFTTADETAPSVVSAVPAHNASEVPLSQNIVVTFDEGLEENPQFADIIKLAPASSPGSAVAGNYNTSPDRKIVTFTPSAMIPNLRYRITVTGQKDIFGNAQNNVFTSEFTTIDNSPPILYDFRIDSQIAVEGLVVENQRPRFDIHYTDDFGVNTAATKLYLAKQGEDLVTVEASVSQTQLQYQPSEFLESGQYVTKVVVTDTAGNETSTPLIAFTINPQVPELLGIVPNYGVHRGNDVVTVKGRNLLSQFTPPDESARGLLGEYYSSYYASYLRLVRTDGEINFDLRDETFTPYIDRDGDQIVFWRGKIIPRYSEEYTFTFELSGGVRIYINEQLVVNQTAFTTVRQATGTVSLEAGQAYDIRIEHFPYYLYQGYSFGSYGERHPAKLFWSSASQNLEIVPQEQLRPAPRAVAPAVLFDGTAGTVLGAATNSNGEDQISILTPPHSEGRVDVEVRVEPDSLTLEDGFEYYQDTNPPNVQRISPSGVSNIPPPGRITVAFNEPLAAEQDFNNVVKLFRIEEEFVAVAGNVTLDETKRKLTFVPSSPLAEDKRYIVSVNNQTDTVGNTATYEYTAQFSTTDRSAPVFYFFNPEDQSTTFDRQPLISAFFQDLMSSIDGNSSVMILDGVDISNQAVKSYSTIQYRPATLLSYGLHTVTYKIFDIAGNTAERSVSFTVVPDTEPPVITSFTIDNREAVDGVQTRYRKPSLVVGFTDNGSLVNNQQKIYLGAQGGTLSPINANVYGGSGSWTMYASPSQELEFGFYTVRAELIDSAGNTTIRTVNFELIDLETVPPTVAEVTPARDAQQVAENTTVVATFNEPLAPNQNFTDVMSVTHSQTGQRVEGAYLLNAEGNTLTFTPGQPLESNSSYQISLQNYLDLAGNAGCCYGSSFSTVDTRGPVIQARLNIGGEYVDLNNTRIYSKSPEIVINCWDDLSGIDNSSFSFTVDGVNHTLQTCNYGASYRPPMSLSVGNHTVTAQVADIHGNVSQISGTFEVIPEPNLPFALEDDTVMLWRLDDFYCSDGCNIPDSGPFGFYVDTYSNASHTGGRFDGGARSPRMTTSGDTQVLYPGANSFTVEGWLHYQFDEENPPSNSSVLWSRGIDSQKEYTLTLLANGDLQARLLNSSGVIWEANLSKAVFDTVDGQWHSLAMVVERGASAEQNQLKLYVDGALRASAQSPDNFGSVRNTNGQFTLGSSNQLSELKMDEIRLSNTAHTAERILKNYNKQEMGLVVLRALPNVVQQGADSELTLEGYNLDEITVAVTAVDGSNIPVSATVLNSTPIAANIKITSDAAVPTGDVLMTLTSGGWTTNVPLRVVNQQPFNAEVGTLLLWHLEETSGSVLFDSGPYGINGFTYYSSVDGRFGKTRKYEVQANTNPAILSMGNSGFTVEGWVKPDDYGDGYIFRKGQIENNSEAFALGITGNVIRARLRDAAQVIWEAKTNPQQVRIRDEKWHYVSMVVERGAAANENRLLIYIDGVERANVQAPASFGSLRNTTQVFVAGSSPSTIDEVRILNFARTAEQITETWFGASSGFSAAKNNKKAFDSKSVSKQNRKDKSNLPKTEKPPAKIVTAGSVQSLWITRKSDQSTNNR